MIKSKKQKILRYPAIFQKSEDGVYNVSFPDFPGCVTFGKNFEEAKKMAQEALELWLEELTERQETISAYSARPIIDEVAADVPPSAKISYSGQKC
jgi:predicted RNase H-like HicB family nuclease